MLGKLSKHIKNRTLIKTVMNFYSIRFIRYFITLKLRYWSVPRCSFELQLPKIKGPCVVFGSAPNAVKPKGYTDGWTLITANASQIITQYFRMKIPDYSVINGGVLYVDDDIYESLRNAIDGGRTKHLLVHTGEGNKIIFYPNDQRIIINRLANFFHYSYDKITFMPRAYLNKLPSVLLDKFKVGYDEITMGLYSILIAHYLGADPIIISGFSFRDNHYFFKHPLNKKKDTIRGHLEKDRETLNQMIKQGFPIYATDEQFAKDTGLKLWDQELKDRSSF